jgi:hypothetical protein
MSDLTCIDCGGPTRGHGQRCRACANAISHPRKWTPERLHEIRERWALGETTREIAIALGTTTDAVIGAASRNGIKNPHAPIAIRWFPPARPREPYAFELVRPGECLFPFGDPGRDGFRFCRAPTDRLPYCATHHKLCYSPGEYRMREPVE